MMDVCGAGNSECSATAIGERHGEGVLGVVMIDCLSSGVVVVVVVGRCRNTKSKFTCRK